MQRARSFPSITVAVLIAASSPALRAAASSACDAAHELAISRMPPPDSKTFGDPKAQPPFPTTCDVKDMPFPELRYERFTASVTKDFLRWDQIIQGKLGSCFFLATLAAIANSRPGYLDDAVSKREDGTYSVRLYSVDGIAVAVSLDDSFPALPSGDIAFARGAEKADIRAALFEKAYAKILGGYEQINAGYTRAALAALIGNVGNDPSLEGMSEDEVWSLLKDNLRSHRPIIANSESLEALKSKTGREDLDGMIEDHAYTVLELIEGDGVRSVRLYSPLSPGDAGYSPDGSRLIVLPIDRFLKYFEGVTVSSAK